MSLDNYIQQWVSLDNQLKQLNETIKQLREKRTTLTNSINEYVKKNNVQQSNFQISDGRLKITEAHVAEPLTFKYLDKVLSEIIKNPEQVKQIVNHLKEKREIKVVPEIKRFSNN